MTSSGILKEIGDILETGGYDSEARFVHCAISGSPQIFEKFLKSNELWGGSGSIADNPFSGRSAQRKQLEKLLVQLGKTQLRKGIANVRTRMWVTAFEKWQESQI